MSECEEEAEWQRREPTEWVTVSDTLPCFMIAQCWLMSKVYVIFWW